MEGFERDDRKGRTGKDVLERMDWQWKDWKVMIGKKELERNDLEGCLRK
jgi:hypothetical protein